MMQITVDSFADAYAILRKELLLAPLACPRGTTTKELLGVTIHLRNPRNRLGWHPDRNYSLPLYVAESVMLFSPSDSVEHLTYINPRMKMFSDNGKTLYGAYGNRIHNEIRDVIRKLKDDPNTRQAVLPIIREFDLRVQTKDFPCTQVLQFLLRDNKLHLFTTMRSNDFIWGLQYDLPVFTTFQEIVANTLGVDVGEYWHTAQSLHVYDYHFDLLDSITYLQPVEFPVHYTMKDMPSLIHLIETLKNQHPEHMLTATVFDAICAAFLRKKKQLPYQDLVGSAAWADQFMRYKVDDEH